MSARKKSYSGFGMGFLRPFAAVLVLTAFILVITFAVRGLGELKTDTVVSVTKPLLAKLNINLNDNRVSKLAGNIYSRITNTDLGSGTISIREDITEEASVSATNELANAEEQPQVAGTSSDRQEATHEIAFMADAHSDYTRLSKALDTAKQLGVSTVFYLGDFTNWGVVEDLINAKKTMDASELKYYAIAGDHDLWKSVGHENYNQVFGEQRHSVTIDDVKYVFLDNSANYTVVPEDTVGWFKKEAADADFVIMSQPLYATKLDRYMGRINGEDVREVLAQRNELLSFIRSTDIKAVIAADLHTTDSVDDPEKPGLSHILIGAITAERNLQSPRFSIFRYYADDSYDFENVVLE